MSTIANVIRLVFEGATDGERLAAIAAFRRLMVKEGLDVHEIARRVAAAPATAEVEVLQAKLRRADALYDEMLGIQSRAAVQYRIRIADLEIQLAKRDNHKTRVADLEAQLKTS